MPDKLVAPADFDGPTKNRHCTDVLCGLILIACWIAMSIIGFLASQEGDLRLIFYPLDFDGNICGTDYALNMTDYPNLLYINHFTGGVCVDKCPDLKGLTDDDLTDIHTLVTYGSIFQTPRAQLSQDFVGIGDYSASNDTIDCTIDSCFPNLSAEKSWSSPGIRQGYGYAYYAASTYELLYRCYLTPSAERRLAEQVGDDTISVSDVAIIDDLYNFWNKAYADVYLARNYVLGFGFGLSMLVSMVYIFLMRLPGLLNAIIWTSIATTILLCLLGGYYACSTAALWDQEEPQTASSKTIRVTYGFGVFLLLLGLLLAVLACCLRKSIMVAIRCTKETCKAVNHMVLILLVPVLQSLGLFVFMVPWVYYAAYLASTGEITTQDVTVGADIPFVDGDQAPEIAFRVFEFDRMTHYQGWFLLFVFFWTSNFIVGLGDLIISVSVSKWYFARNKIKIGSWTVIGSIGTVLWYHAGTAAFGSLLVAIIQFIRAILARIQKTVKKSKSRLAQAILCCCQCCFWCLETILKFINKNAYIQTAIFSTSFCKSCREAFALIARNITRVAAVSYVSACVLIVGKLFISAIVTVISYYALVEKMNDKLYSVAGPLAVIFLISYFISDMFMDVIDIGISTVLHCFIADEEMFEEEERYAQKSLKTYIDRHGSVRDDE